MEEQVQQFLRFFSGILWEAFPFVVLGAVIGGILEELVPQQAITKIVPKNRFLAVGLGACLGIVFPMCECGIVVVMRRLLRKGVPLGTCVAYMLNGPILNVVVLTSTFYAFRGYNLGVQMMVLRAGLGFIVAVVTGLLVERMVRTSGIKSLTTPLARPDQDPVPGKISLTVLEEAAAHRVPTWRRLSNISETALRDFVDIMVFLTLGAILAAVAKLQISNDDVQRLSTYYPALTILAMMGLAILMCLCSEADAFVAASFATMHISGKVAFLVFGPMFDLKLLMMFTRVFRKKLIITIFASVLVQVFIYSMLFYYYCKYRPDDWLTRAGAGTPPTTIER